MPKKCHQRTHNEEWYPPPKKNTSPGGRTILATKNASPLFKGKSTVHKRRGICLPNYEPWGNQFSDLTISRAQLGEWLPSMDPLPPLSLSVWRTGWPGCPGGGRPRERRPAAGIPSAPPARAAAARSPRAGNPVMVVVGGCSGGGCAALRSGGDVGFCGSLLVLRGV